MSATTTEPATAVSQSVQDGSISGGLAAFIADTRFADLPTTVVDRMKRSVLDAIGCAIYGSASEAARAPLEYLKIQHDNPGELILRPSELALLDATYIHTTEFGETFARAVVHPGTVVVPAALAVTSARRGSGRDLLSAIAVGFEVDIRLGLAAGHGVITQQLLHAPTIWGTFASTAAAANAHGFDFAKTASAMGVASCLVPSAQQQALREHASVKDIYQGHASSLGVAATDLVLSGITGPHEWVEPWYASIIRSYDLSPILDRLAEFWHVDTGGLRIKTRPVMAMAQPTMEAVTQLVAAGAVETESIKRVIVESSGRIEMGRIYRPTGIVSARAAIPFLVAAGLMHQQELLADPYMTNFIRTDYLNDPAVHALADRIELVTNQEFDDNFERAEPAGPDAYMKYEARVTVEFADRPTRTQYADVFAIGTGRMTFDQVAQKFRALTEAAVPTSTAENIVDIVRDLESCSDVRELSRLLPHHAFAD
jgi:aconitate decarboxylase